ncbi:hypothetical protein FGADI_1881 [Fusarium gaditjirri]|uniref:Ankyrin n=1 Tax=Fusarium gaditjirri TaxID=282569 RepID=A0A8H4TJQ4_9HYPO|nr:hypothetical protein FGADI_1881 [Fusarium gaditjirri]
MDRNNSFIAKTPFNAESGGAPTRRPDLDANADFDILSFVGSHSDRHVSGLESEDEEYRKEEKMLQNSAIDFDHRKATDENARIDNVNPHPKLSIAHDLVSFLLNRKAATSYLFRRHQISSNASPHPFPLNVFMGQWTSWTSFALSKSKKVQPGTLQCCQLMKPGDIEVITVSNDKFVQLMSLLGGDELLMMSIWETPDASTHWKSLAKESLLGEFMDLMSRTTWIDWDIALPAWFGLLRSDSIDLVVHAIATFLHDLGWDMTEESPIFSADRRFEVDGAFAAREFIQEHQDGKFWGERNVQLVWDAIALHTERSISYFKELDVQVVSKGIAMDFSGPAYGVAGEDYAVIAKAFAKNDLKDSVNQTIIWLCETKPQTTYVSYVLYEPSTGAAVYHFGRHELQHNLADYNLALRSITRQLVSRLSEESTLPAQISETIDDGFGDVESTVAILQMLPSELSRIIIIFDGVDASNEAGLREMMEILLRKKARIQIMMTSQRPPSDTLIDTFGMSTITACATDQDLSLYHVKAIDEAPVSAQVLDDSHTSLFPYQKLMDMADGRFLPIIRSWFTNIASQPNTVLLSLVESWSPNSNVDVPRAFCQALVNDIQTSRHSDMTLCSLYYLVYGEENGYTFTPSMLWEALIAWGIRDEDNTVFTLTQISNACADFAFIDAETKIMKLRSPLLMDFLRTEVFDDNYHARHIRATFRYLTRGDHEGACKSSGELKERLRAHPFLCYAARTLSPSLAVFPALSYDIDFLKMTASHRSVDSYLQAAEAWPYIDEESYNEFEAEEERWRCYTKAYTPLHLAAHFGARETLVQLLVDRGDNIEARAANGQTALHIAAEIGDSSHVVKRLLECGANVAAVDEDGLTPLVHAIVYGCLESVRLLISHGADINALEDEDLLECSRAKPDVAEFLVGLGVEMPVEESESEE